MREPVERSVDQRLRHRTYLYVDTGNGFEPESGVGGIPHDVRLRNI